MYWTLCRSYIGPDGPNKGKEASKPSKEVMRKHEGSQLIIYNYNIKGQQASIQNGRKQAFKEAKNGSEGHLSALYVNI